MSVKMLLIVIITIGCIQINNVDCQLNELFHWKQLTFNNINNNNINNINVNNNNNNNNNDQNINYTKYQNDEIIFMDDDHFSSKLNRGRALNDNRSTNNNNNNNKQSSADTNNNNNYIPYNNIPMGVSHYKDKLFITIPRRRPGVPSTLNYISLKSSNMERSPSLIAYPNNKMNELNPQMQPDISKIISVYRTRIDDKCNRLWFIDTGRLEYLENPIQVQRPSIWIIDLVSNKPIRRYEIPRNIVEVGQGMASITIDVDETSSSSANGCDNAHAYIPDLLHNRLYVYSLNANRMWSFNHNAFSFDPIYGDFNVADLEYQWNDGIFSITLGNRNDDGFKTAYFHAMVSISEFMVSTEVLRNETLSTRSYHGNDFKLLGIRGQNTQSAMHDFDENSGIIFYSQIGINGISCWNTVNEFSPNNHVLIAQDNETMIYPADVNVDSDGILWVLTNSLPLFLYSTLDTDEYNFRIWKQSVSEAISGTDCKR